LVETFFYGLKSFAENFLLSSRNCQKTEMISLNYDVNGHVYSVTIYLTSYGFSHIEVTRIFTLGKTDLHWLDFWLTAKLNRFWFGVNMVI